MPQLRTLIFDLSYACNYSCATCRCPSIDAALGQPRLSLARAARVIDQSRALGATDLLLFGGEPLLVRHVYDVIRYADKIGMTAEITTNASAATVSNARRLLACGTSTITVSIDGGRRGHERVRGPGTFDATINGLRNLQTAIRECERHVTFRVQVVVSRVNYQDFDDLLDDLVEFSHDLEVSVAHFARLTAEDTREIEALLSCGSDHRRNHWALPADLLLRSGDVDELQNTVERFKKRATKYGIRIAIDPALDSCFNAESLLRGAFRLSKPCRVFEECLIVGADGAIGSCPMLTHFSFGNVHTHRIADIWEDSGSLHVLRRRMRSGYLPICKRCCIHHRLM